jgi:hypothetical protein
MVHDNGVARAAATYFEAASRAGHDRIAPALPTAAMLAVLLLRPGTAPPPGLAAGKAAVTPVRSAK